MGLFKHEPPKDWAAIDRENERGMDILTRAMSAYDLETLTALWQEANKLVGQRAPAERAAFLAYGYCQGKKDALLAELQRKVDRA